MYRYNSTKQLKVAGFETEFELGLDAHNRWVKLSSLMPWDELVNEYIQSLSDSKGSPGIAPRVAVGALVIKHLLDISDRETISMIKENPYMQYFIGLNHFQPKAVFDPSLFVDLRKRMQLTNYDKINQLLIKLSRREDENYKGKGRKKKLKNWGRLQLDATVADQYIKYPTDLDLLNESREWAEKIIDEIYPKTFLEKKPRTYRRVARRDYLNVAKKKKKSRKEIRKAIRKQLNYLNRDFKYISNLLNMFEDRHFPLSKKSYRYFLVIKEVYRQQKQMFDNRTNRCDDRIVSIHQPHVRPIVRGKAKHKVEFGSKISLSLNNGFSRIDRLNWNAFNESLDLKMQVEAYKSIHGVYPELVQVDKIYATKENREWLKEHNIRLTAKPLGRPAKQTRYEKQKSKEEFNDRNQIEGKFGQGKNGNSLNMVRARLRETSESWIAGIIFVLNLKRLSGWSSWK